MRSDATAYAAPQFRQRGETWQLVVRATFTETFARAIHPRGRPGMSNHSRDPTGEASGIAADRPAAANPEEKADRTRPHVS